MLTLFLVAIESKHRNLTAHHVTHRRLRLSKMFTMCITFKANLSRTVSPVNIDSSYIAADKVWKKEINKYSQHEPVASQNVFILGS